MNKISPISKITVMILVLRGQRVILDRDLALIYGISTKRLNEAVKRNIERFPDDFMFRLRENEMNELVANCDHLRGLKFSYQMPYAFTRNGANMVSAILRTQLAVRRSIYIMRAFSALEEAVKGKKNVTESPRILKELAVHSRAIMRLFQSDKNKTIRMEKLQEMQKQMSHLIQKIILSSLKNGDK